MIFGSKRRRRRSWQREPEDARRGLLAPLPRNHSEAAADREMAEAERAAARR